MDEIGFDEYIYSEGISLIEWADNIEDILPDKYIRVDLSRDLEKGFDHRSIKVESVGD